MLVGDVPLAIVLQAVTLAPGIVQIPYKVSVLAGATVTIPIESRVRTLIIDVGISLNRQGER